MEDWVPCDAVHLSSLSHLGLTAQPLLYFYQSSGILDQSRV